MKKLIGILAFSVLMMCGCAAHVTHIMNSWVGSSSSDLIAKWGPPSQVFNDGSGGTVMVWAYQRSYTVPGNATTNTTGSATLSGNTVYGSSTSRTTYNPAQNYGWTAYRMFWVNQSGIVYRWAWRGL